MNEKFIEKRLRKVSRQSYGNLSEIASKLKGVIRLSSGDPDFKTPKHIIDATIRAIEEEWTHYAPMTGIPELRGAITNYHSKYGTNWESSEVIVTCGSYTALYVALAGTLNIKDEVIILEPFYMAYPRLLEYIGVKEIRAPLEEDEGYHVNLEALKEKITSKTKMIIICSPNNPTGTTFTKDELKEISDIALENDLLILSDEIYNEFLYDDAEHFSIAALPEMRDRTLVCMSFSKTFAMTGWRMGFVIAPEYIATRIARIPIGYRPASFIQKAGIAALNGPWEPINKMKKEYDLRRRYFSKRLDEIDGIDCQMPEGAFYVFPNIRDIGMKSVDFSKTLLEKEKVWVTPGLMFGPSGEYHIRMPLIKPTEILEKVADAIETHTKKIMHARV